MSFILTGFRSSKFLESEPLFPRSHRCWHLFLLYSKSCRFFFSSVFQLNCIFFYANFMRNHKNDKAHENQNEIVSWALSSMRIHSCQPNKSTAAGVCITSITWNLLLEIGFSFRYYLCMCVCPVFHWPVHRVIYQTDCRKAELNYFSTWKYTHIKRDGRWRRRREYKNELKRLPFQFTLCATGESFSLFFIFLVSICFIECAKKTKYFFASFLLLFRWTFRRI